MHTIDALKAKLILLGNEILIEGDNSLIVLQGNNDAIMYTRNLDKTEKTNYLMLFSSWGQDIKNSKNKLDTNLLLNDYYIGYKYNKSNNAIISDILDNRLNLVASFFDEKAQEILLNEYVILRCNVQGFIRFKNMHGLLISDGTISLTIYILDADSKTIIVHYTDTLYNSYLLKVKENNITKLCPFKSHKGEDIIGISKNEIIVQRDNDIIIYNYKGIIKLAVKEAKLVSESVEKGKYFENGIIRRISIRDKFNTLIKEVDILENKSF